MLKRPPRVLDLVEWTPSRFSLTDLSLADVARIAQTTVRRITITWSDPQSAYVELLSKGWVGTVRCSEDLSLRVLPRFHLDRLLQLVKWTEYGSGPATDDTVPIGAAIGPEKALTDRFVRLLRSITADGLHKGYHVRRVDGQVIRGRILMRETVQLHARGNVGLAYEQYILTPDLPENWAVLWTAHILLGRTDPSEPAHWAIAELFSAMTRWVSLKPVTAAECRSFRYDSRTERYRDLHELCAMILEGSSPEHQVGSTQAFTFGVETSRLFEMALARALSYMSGEYKTESQVIIELAKETVEFRMDNVIYDRASDLPLAVVDAKYKRPSDLDSADVQQVIAYAAATNSKEAILVYPLPDGLFAPFMVGGIRVSSLALDLSKPVSESVADLCRNVAGLVKARGDAVPPQMPSSPARQVLSA